MLKRSGLTFQGLASLDGGGEPDGPEGRDFVYTARLEADRFGRPAPVTQWPGLGLEDPSSAAAAINAWIDPQAGVKTKSKAAGDEATRTAEGASTGGSSAERATATCCARPSESGGLDRRQRR